MPRRTHTEDTRPASPGADKGKDEAQKLSKLLAAEGEREQAIQDDEVIQQREFRSGSATYTSGTDEALAKYRTQTPSRYYADFPPDTPFRDLKAHIAFLEDRLETAEARAKHAGTYSTRLGVNTNLAYFERQLQQVREELWQREENADAMQVWAICRRCDSDFEQRLAYAQAGLCTPCFTALT